MLIYVFKSSKFEHAFTQDPTGSNLPNKDGSWQYYKDLELRDTDKRIGMDSKQAIEAIKSEGYFIVPAGIGDISG